MGLFKKEPGQQESSKYVAVLTSDLKCSYQPIDSIFALDSDKAGILFGPDPSEAFEGVKEKLRKKCIEYGGDAVICCKFDYRIALSQSFFAGGDKQIVELWAYGTVVKFI